ncbi:MAG: transporter substrate-binding domain-containing protein [Pseudomonadales bacterium]|nr:transporter substrate-binding domain-containing protein [Pseudomonadales bacterium]
MPPSIAEILDRGTLRVAMYSRDTPPFYYRDEKGELTGIDVHIIRGFANLLGVDVEFDRSAATFNAVIDKVANREVDLAICKLSMTFSRAMRVRFTEPYIVLHQGLLINRLKLAQQAGRKSKEEAIQNLKGKIGVIGKSSYVEYAKQRFKNTEIIQYPSWKAVVDGVLNGEVVAGYRDDAEIKKIIRDQPETALKLLTVVFKDALDPKGIAVAWDSVHLQFLLDFYIESLGLQLSADKVLHEYDAIISAIETKSPKSLTLPKSMLSVQPGDAESQDGE